MSKPEISLHKSKQDGTWVVYIDTPDMPEDSNGPIIRVWLNDETIFENPTVPSWEVSDE
ncbi:MAG: hypothetical protein GY759_09035 [Chloroflexi bacterium]|nr:hypothetical protein [Chloroflexota bacterium]